MQVVAVIISLLLTFVIAAVVIGRETNRLIDQSPRPVFDMEEALAWISERLAFEVTAVLSYEELEFVLISYLEEINRKNALQDAKVLQEAPDEPVISDADALVAVMARLDEESLTVSEDHVRRILELQVAYFQAIGAAGPPQVVDS